MPFANRPVTQSEPSASNASASGELGELTRLTMSAGLALASWAAGNSSPSLSPFEATRKWLKESKAMPMSSLKSAPVMVCGGGALPNVAALGSGNCIATQVHLPVGGRNCHARRSDRGCYRAGDGESAIAGGTCRNPDFWQVGGCWVGVSAGGDRMESLHHVIVSGRSARKRVHRKPWKSRVAQSSRCR